MGQRTKDYEKKKWGFVRIIGSLLLAFGFVGLIQHEGIIGFVLASGIGIFGMVMIYYGLLSLLDTKKPPKNYTYQPTKRSFSKREGFR